MKMEQVVTHRIDILFQLVYSLLFTDQSVYFCVSNCSWNWSLQWSLRTKLLSISNKLWKKSWPHIAASNYLYLFVWANFCILFILLSKQACNGPETEL